MICNLHGATTAHELPGPTNYFGGDDETGLVVDEEGANQGGVLVLLILVGVS